MKNEHTFIDRDISWLSFNERVMLEATKPYTPTMEKLKFLAIYSSNLDEFYRVRVAAFQRAVSDNKGKAQDFEDLKMTLENIQSIVDDQQERFGKIFREIVLPELSQHGISIWKDSELDEVQKAFLLRYFQTIIRGLIHFQEDKVFLENRQLYMAVVAKDQDERERIIYLNIPSDLKRFINLPSSDGHLFIFIDDIIRLHLNLLLPQYEILSAYSIKINRDAELYLEEEYHGDIRRKILRSLSKRSGGAPSRLLIDEAMPNVVRDLVGMSLGLKPESFINGGRYHNYFDFFGFPNAGGERLEYPSLKEIKIRAIEDAKSLLDLIEQGDRMLHFPYQSYEYVLRFFNEAATDSSVTEIRATMYRMSSSSAIARALITAAKNGKKVVVFVELKARFDEENNIEWAAKMKKAGVKIIFSIPEIKVHAKVALVTRKLGKNKSRIAFYGTGNFNEKTAKIYTDHALLTADEELNEELNRLLRHLENGKVQPKPNQLLVAGFNMVKKFNALIDREIEFARRRKKAEITIKLNNLQDKPMIRKLYEAAANGVKVNLIIRGICCLNPEMSENINVYRVVGRFLEHGRIFRFENDGNRAIYLGSADWMKRNLHHRIEVIFPIREEALKKEIEDFIKIQLSAHRGTVVLDSALSNHFPFEEVSDVSAQEAFYKLLVSKEKLVNTEFA